MSSSRIPYPQRVQRSCKDHLASIIPFDTKNSASLFIKDSLINQRVFLDEKRVDISILSSNSQSSFVGTQIHTPGSTAGQSYLVLDRQFWQVVLDNHPCQAARIKCRVDPLQSFYRAIFLIWDCFFNECRICYVPYFYWIIVPEINKQKLINKGKQI